MSISRRVLARLTRKSLGISWPTSKVKVGSCSTTFNWRAENTNIKKRKGKLLNGSWRVWSRLWEAWRKSWIKKLQKLIREQRQLQKIIIGSQNTLKRLSKGWDKLFGRCNSKKNSTIHLWLSSDRQRRKITHTGRIILSTCFWIWWREWEAGKSL